MRLRRSRHPASVSVGAGVALRGRLWCGDGTEYDDGRVVVDAAGRVAAFGAAADVPAPYGVTELTGAWVGPGIVDAHVHLAFADPADLPARGVVAVRDLGAPPADAARWRLLPAPRVEVAGPVLTSPTGYPSRGWGSAGFAAFLDDPAQAERLVTGLAQTVDVVKIALESEGGPVPDLALTRAAVDAAHAAGRRVTCHALTVPMVERALDAGVDELAHTPTEPLPEELVTRIVERGVAVVSTLQTFVAAGGGAGAVANAAALVAAGATVRYGTDLGNTGTAPGADPRELRLLADAGLGPEGALRAATEPLRIGAPAGAVVLRHDPRERPATWRTPRAVVCGTKLLA